MPSLASAAPLTPLQLTLATPQRRPVDEAFAQALAEVPSFWLQTPRTECALPPEWDAELTTAFRVLRGGHAVVLRPDVAAPTQQYRESLLAVQRPLQRALTHLADLRQGTPIASHVMDALELATAQLEWALDSLHRHAGSGNATDARARPPIPAARVVRTPWATQSADTWREALHARLTTAHTQLADLLATDTLDGTTPLLRRWIDRAGTLLDHAMTQWDHTARPERAQPR